MALEDYREKVTCTRCGQCRRFTKVWKNSCPSGTKYKFEMYYSSGFAWIADAILDGRVELDESNVGYIYSCALCRACSEMCPVAYSEWSMEVVRSLREEAVEKGLVIQKVSEFLENVFLHGNPYGEPREKRGDWVNGTALGQYKKGDDYLYYVGCVGSYDAESQKSAKAVGHLLSRAGVSFGLLGKDEICDGNEVRNLGETGLFDHLVERQSEAFQTLEVKKIVTLSPHSFHILKNEYPKHGVNMDVVHYTQLVRDLVKGSNLDVSKGFNARVTYHDPCMLGRWNNEYEAPREILSSIPGVELVEMERNRERAFCCGGGGGNFYTDLLGGKNGSACERVREAYDTGAEVLAIACPVCRTMLADAIKTEGLVEKLKLMDIAEVVKEALGS
jgi:Fe-S oxidoreductase